MSASETLVPSRFVPGLLRRIAGRGLTVREVAIAMNSVGAGISPATLYNIANGKSPLDVGDAVRLAKLLDWTTEELTAAITEARERTAAKAAT